MRTKILKLFCIAFITTLLFALLTMTVSAEIKVENGTVTGLDSTVYYQYSKVNFLTYASPSYVNVPAASETIENLEPGLYYIRNKKDGSITVVHVEGSHEDMSDIGVIVNNDSYDALNVHQNNSFALGKWGYANMYEVFAPYTLTVGGGQHVDKSYAEGYDNGIYTAQDIAEMMMASSFKYAYLPEEIIHIDNLVSFSFDVGVRQGSFTPVYDTAAPSTDLFTRYVLYIMDSAGKVTPHEAYVYTAYAYKNPQSVYVSADFADADGWVVAMEVFPYGKIPTEGLSFEVKKSNSNAYINTIFQITYKPDSYKTAYNNITSQLSIQYNGTNIAYVGGYEDGTFKPDAKITKAEAAYLLARLVSDFNIPTGKTTAFTDVESTHWAYDAIAYLESIDAFDYISDGKFNPSAYIIRAEFAQILANLTSYEQTGLAEFSDVASTYRYAKAIYALADDGTFGITEGKFRPTAEITRAEAITYINHVLNLVANERTVDRQSLTNTFSDISGHAAEYEILMAANSNVKTLSHSAASTDGITETSDSIYIENDYFKIVIKKHGGAVTSIINKANGENIIAASASPWFIYATTDTDATVVPVYASLSDGRIKFVMANDIDIYVIVTVKDNYITVELDSELPYGTKTARFANLRVNTEYSSDENSYRLSGISMNANTNCVNLPGGESKMTTAGVSRKFGTIGAKLGVAFSKLGDMKTGTHVQCLRDITDAIDSEVGIKSTKGGAYSLTVDDLGRDYVILSSLSESATSNSSAQRIAQDLIKYNITQIDIHQNSSSSFRHGDFNFVCAKRTGETFTTAAQFKERIGDTLHANGIQYSLHTFSSLVDAKAVSIITDPVYQKQLMYDEVLTLKAAIGTSNRSLTTNEDASGLTLGGLNTNGSTSALPYNGPYSGYFLIDEEIILVTATSSSGFTSISRGQFGTTAASHAVGAEIRHLLVWYTMFQPIPGSDLFYLIAENTAKAYVDGGFDMIYLDGFESFAKFNGYNTYITEDAWYYYSTFVQRLVSTIQKLSPDGEYGAPMIEGSVFPANFWNARGRGGAWDSGVRSMKHFIYDHTVSNTKFLNNFLTATQGWFNFAPDRAEAYKNTFKKEFFRDDIEYKGAMTVAFDMSTVANGYSLYNYSTYATLSDNTLYHSLFSKLRQAGYFSDSVKKTLKQGLLEGKEYKLVEKTDGTYAFKEAVYDKNTVYDMNNYTTGTANNPFLEQIPYVRIEQRYSTFGENALVLLEEYTVKDAAESDTYKDFNIGTTNLTGKNSFKVTVTGNGIEGSAVLISLMRKKSDDSVSEKLDFFVQTDFEGTREFVLMDADNDDYDGYDFAGDYLGDGNHATYRGTFTFDNPNAVRLAFAGDCTGVVISDFTACKPVNSPVENPSITIGENILVFKTTLRSGEYVEYFPELNRAYKHAYGIKSDGSSTNVLTISEVEFEGTLKVPKGDYSYTYGYATASSTAPVRAKTVIGVLAPYTIQNEASWIIPELPEGTKELYYVTLGDCDTESKVEGDIMEFIYGDLDNDGIVSNKDSAIVARYLARWSGYEITNPLYNFSAADVDCDGIVTNKDSATIARHLARWSGYEMLPKLN